MKTELILRDFQGAIGTLGTTRDKVGSARFTKNLNPFEDQDYVTLSRKTAKVSSTTVVNLPLWMEDGSPFTTNRFVYDLGGKIYSVDSADAVTLLRTVTGGAGEGLKVFDDYLYYMLGTNIGRYGRLTGTPAFNDDLTSWWTGAISDIRTTGGAGGVDTYSTAVAISETSANRKTFTANKDPIKSVTVDITDTGDDPNWTVTIHDSENNVIGSKQILFASVTTGDTIFAFSSPLRVVIGNSYHIHVTTSTTTGAPKVRTTVASNLEGAEFTVEYGVLIDNDFHPCVVIEDLLVIGNKRYLATFNQATYDPCAIAFDPGFQVRTLIKNEEYVIAECYKGASPRLAEESKRYYWDGIQPSFNFSEPISVGSPNASTFIKGENFAGVYGFRGNLYDSKSESELTNEIPKLTRGKYIEVFPGAIANYENKVLVGYAGATDDTTGVEQGVYEYGGQSAETPVGLNFPFVISTGSTQGTNQKIGLVKVIGKDIYVGWRDNTTYGLDKTTLGTDAATSGIYESLIFDAGNAKKQKLAIQLKATFQALATGESLTLAYQIDRSGSFTAGDAVNTVGEIEAELAIYSRFKEIEFKFTLASSAGTFPKLTSLIFTFEKLSSEDVE